jgi:hypothetical protein
MAAAGGGAEKEAIRTKIRIQMNIRGIHFGFESIIHFTPLFAQSPTPPGIEFPLAGKPGKLPPRWKEVLHFLSGESRIRGGRLTVFLLAQKKGVKESRIQATAKSVLFIGFW